MHSDTERGIVPPGCGWVDSGARAVLVMAVVVAALTAGVGLGAAQGADSGQNGDAGPPSDLPAEAADVAKDVVAALSDVLRGGPAAAIEAIGDLVRSIAGGGS